jgi:energy-coupling factor transporter transmembrane protein EcfT
VLGLVSLAVAVVGFVFACIPGALIIGWVLLPIAFVLSIVALFLKGRGKAFALSALILSIVGTVVGFVVFFAVVANSFDDAFNPKSEVKPPAASGASSDGAEASDAADGSAAKTGTRENPAPLGSDIVGREFTVKINTVNLAANDAVLAANEFNDAPDAGMVYALVNATITYTGEDSGYANQAVISYVSADGNVFNSYDKFVSPPEPAFGLDELYAGASVTGNLVIQIPAAGDGLIRVTPGIIADNVFVATK